MSRRALPYLSVCFLLGVTFGVSAQTTVVKGTSALSGLPDSTSMLIRVSSMSKLISGFKASPLYALRTQPAIKLFLDEANQEIEKQLAEARERLGYDPLDLLTAWQGEVLVAVGSLEKIISGIVAEISGGGGADSVKPGDLPLIFVADAGANRADVQTKLDKIFEIIQAEGGRKEQEDFRGGKITTFVNTRKQGDNDIDKVFFGSMGSSFFFSINRPYLESTMAGMSGAASSSLASDQDFMTTNAEIGEADIQVFVNVRSIRRSVQKTIQANPFYGMFWGLIETKLIGTGLKNLATGMSLNEKGIYSKSFFNTGGKRDGLLGLLDGPAFSTASIAKGVPGNVDSLNASTFNFANFYQLIREIANMAMGMAQGNVGMDVEQLLELQFQIKIREVIDALGTRLFYYTKSAGGDEANPFAALENPFGQKIVFGVALKAEAPIKKLLGQLPAILAQNMVLPAESIKTEKYLEREIYKFDAQGPALALVDKNLVFSAGLDDLKEFIRHRANPGNDLASDEGYTKQTSSIPEQISAVSYMKKDYMKESLAPLNLLLMQQGSFPDLGKIVEVFGAGAGFATWKDKGYFSSSWMLFQEK